MDNESRRVTALIERAAVAEQALRAGLARRLSEGDAGAKAAAPVACVCYLRECDVVACRHARSCRHVHECEQIYTRVCARVRACVRV